MSVEPGFELFDHTADLGIRVRAGTLAELPKIAAMALYSVVGELAVSGPAQSHDWVWADDDDALLLRTFLAELLLIFERDGRMVTRVEVLEFSEKSLRVCAESQLVDAARCVYHREVKAITYHRLAIEPIDGGIEATIIVDI
jgi:SHS2 domain-containing protein